MKTPQERIIELEKLLTEQQKELAAIKAELSKPEANYNGPEKGYYWDRLAGQVINASNGNMNHAANVLYDTPEEAEWQGNSERVRRKLQRIAKALNPTGWKPVHDWIEFTLSDGVGTGIYFMTYALRHEAYVILGDDFKYLNWYNSPEFKK
jgi:hypothetical protein